VSVLPVDKTDDIAAEYAEAALEALHVEDLLEHIPVFKSALVAAKVIGSVRDHLLLKKMAIYLHAITVIPANERRSMIGRLAADSTFDEALGEYLIELLDRVDGRRKPAMVGAVFAAYAFETIDARMLLRLNWAIMNLPSMEIDSVRALGTPRSDRLSMQAIVNAGLAEVIDAASGAAYRLNATGAKFIELELDEINPSA